MPRGFIQPGFNPLKVGNRGCGLNMRCRLYLGLSRKPWREKLMRRKELGPLIDIREGVEWTGKCKYIVLLYNPWIDARDE